MAKVKKPNKTNIGGQAILEGVMMRGSTSMASAVRDEDGIIRLETKRLSKKKSVFSKIPIIRGAINFFTSLVGGVKTLMRSAEVFGGDEPTKFDKWLAKKLKIDIMTLVIYLGVFLGIALSILLFILSPQWISTFILKFTPIQVKSIAFNFIEGGIRILIFIIYLLLVSLSKEIKRTFQYHGAEHKTISCFERGLPLTVENVKSCSRVHDRCGTTFMFFVMLVSIIVFSVVNYFVGASGFWRAVVKIALLPVVAGLSYELLKGLAKTENPIFFPIKLPGLLLQRLTTKEPDDEMIEVAITAFQTVLEMEADQSIEEKEFIVSMRICDLKEKIKKQLESAGITDESESEWIVALTCDVQRSEIAENRRYMRPKTVEKALNVTNERCAGRPLWYVVGDTEFYGRTIKVDERVLIPRPETEEVVAEALKYISSNSKVLDLCTGSGAIAITIKKEKNATVDASDISSDALEVAKENATMNDAQIDFIQSDFFENINNKYDIIISNPPYIKSADIGDLQKEISFEPKLALDGGDDGFDCYRKIISGAKSRLNENGIVIFECGIEQAQTIKEMFAKQGFSNVEVKKDLNGIERIVKAELIK